MRFCGRHSSPTDVEVFENRTVFILTVTQHLKQPKLGFKIGLTLFMIFGFFFFRKVGPILTGRLKDFHVRNKTGLVEKAPVIFKIFTIFFNIASIMCLIYIVMVWTGFVTIPNK